MARKSELARADEPKTNQPSHGVPVSDGTLVRQWSDDELRLPMWLRHSAFPRHVVEYSERRFLMEEWPVPLGHLLALIGLAQGVEHGILRVRQEHAAVPDSIRPETVIHNAVLSMRYGSDELLKQTPPAYVSVVDGRLNRMIEAMKATLDAYMGETLDRILCDNPNCPIRGHMLPGPWGDASKRSAEAYQNAYLLMPFLKDLTKEGTWGETKANLTPTPNPQDCPSIVLTVSQRDILQFLSTQYVARPRTYIADIMPGDRASVSEGVKALVELGFVKDHGKNKGVSILQEGRNWLKQADKE